MTPLQHLLHFRIVAIIRGVALADMLPVAAALHAGGIRIIEVTLNTPDAFSAIETLQRNGNTDMRVGAGTVLDAAAANRAIDAGATFIIAPSTDPETISTTKQRGCVSIPGAYTATEIVHAYRAGADIVKLFPASSPQYLRDLRAPLNHIPMMPTGGVTLDNIAAFHQAGAAAFGIGSALVNGSVPITERELRRITEDAARFVATIANR